MHVVWEMDVDTTSYNDSFNSSISGYPRKVDFYCIIGRDGMNTSDWIVEADNTRNCQPLSADPLSANVPANMQQGQPPRPDHGKKLLRRAGYKESEIAAAYGESEEEHAKAFKKQLMVSMIAAAVVVIVGAVVALWELIIGRKSTDKMKGSGIGTMSGLFRCFWRYIDILSSSRVHSGPSPTAEAEDESAPLIESGSTRYGMC